MAYTKLFASIVTSTIWTEDDKTRIVWITMLALANKHGEVQASIPGLARIAGVSVQATEDAVNKFLAPDPYSRTPDDQGRRIEPIDGGWALLNHAKYRDMASKDEMREAEAKRKRRYRAKIDRNQSGEMSQNVRDMSQDVPKSEHIAEADPDSDSDPFLEPRELPKKPFRENKGNSTTSDLSPLVSAVWSAYPKVGRERSSKADTEESFRKIPAKDRPTPDDITAAVAKWKLSLSWTDDGGAFVPGVHRWVKARQWENIPDPACTTKPSRHAGLNTMEITGNEF